MLNYFNRKKQNQIVIAGEVITPQPLNLEETLNLTILLAPYIGLIESRFAEFERILKNKSGERPQLLSSFLAALVDEINPADFTRVFAILLHKPPEWFRNVTAQELIDSLPELDRVNDFGLLISSIRKLGLTVQYA